MRRTVRLIGSAVFAIAMYSIPVCLACAFALNWDGFWKMLLTVVALVQIFVLFSVVYEQSEVD